MDVPFHSSGALSRAHYTIVRKVETATSIQSADQNLFLEVKSVQAQLSHPRLHPDKCKECLIILLYCSNTVTPGFLANDAFDFAFSYAINLAEAGAKIENKRIGYLFCSEMMPLDHELRLMLVNTLRKDLESEDIGRICLALDNLIASPNEDVIPAVQSRLHDLLSHDYSPVKRRALLAFRALSAHNPALLERIHSTILKRLKDPDDSVVMAALALLGERVPQDEAILSKGRRQANNLLVTESSYINNSNTGMILQVLKVLRVLGLSEGNIPRLLDILREYSHPEDSSPLSKAVVLDIFKSFAHLTPQSLMSAEDSKKLHVVHSISHYLMSDNPDDHYLFLSCLECVDVVVWAGTNPERTAALQGEEFERIMQLLNSPDQCISRKTMRVINKVDPAIIDGQISLIKRTAQTEAPNASVISYLLDIILIRHGEDGGQYAEQIIELVQNLGESSPRSQVFREVVEAILTDNRTSHDASFLASCAAQFVKTLVDTDVSMGPTGLVIAAALCTEYSGSLPTTPTQLLSGLALRLHSCPAIVQEPCIIAMLRVRADWDEVPPEVITVVEEISQNARRLIRARCDQFIEFSKKKEELVQIIHTAASSSLPDFLLALQSHTGEQPRSSASTPQFNRASPRTSKPMSSLKYTAYAPPQVGPRLKPRRMSSTSSSALSDSPSDRLHRASQSQLGSPIMTAGQLALTSGFKDMQLRDTQQLAPPDPVNALVDLQSPRVDLITLDSPFHAEPLSTIESSELLENNADFNTIWSTFDSSCDLRGWCKTSIDTIIRRLQRFDNHRLRVIAADVPPFEGELKILMVTYAKSSSLVQANTIALRLRESEEDSCLWRLRCSDAIVGTQIQHVLDA